MRIDRGTPRCRFSYYVAERKGERAEDKETRREKGDERETKQDSGNRHTMGESMYLASWKLAKRRHCPLEPLELQRQQHRREACSCISYLHCTVVVFSPPFSPFSDCPSNPTPNFDRLVSLKQCAPRHQVLSTAHATALLDDLRLGTNSVSTPCVRVFFT